MCLLAVKLLNIADVHHHSISAAIQSMNVARLRILKCIAPAVIKIY